LSKKIWNRRVFWQLFDKVTLRNATAAEEEEIMDNESKYDGVDPFHNLPPCF
jgi:hypothetical protein